MHRIKNTMNKNDLLFTFYIYVQNFRSLGPIIKIFLNPVPLKKFII